MTAVYVYEKQLIFQVFNHYEYTKLGGTRH